MFFCLLLFEAKFTSFFIDKKSKEVTKQWELRFFLLILLDYRRIQTGSASESRTIGYGSGRPKTYGSGSDLYPASDPRHWFAWLWISITLMRTWIRIQLFTLLRIQLFTLMRIRNLFLIKVMQILDSILSL